MAYIRRRIAIFSACVVLVLILHGVFFDDHFDPAALKGRNVLLTGASSGIGEQMAYYFAKHGANLIITARRENLLQKVTEKCRSLAGEGVTIDYIKADMGNMEDARNVVKKAISILGGIDHLMLNHAMISGFDGFTGTREKVEEVKKYMQVNFHSYVEAASAALPHLMERNGTITVTSSIAGKLPMSNSLPYSTSKFAMQGFFEGLQEEMKERQTNVSITIIPLGPVVTGIEEKMIKPGPNTPIPLIDIKFVKLIAFTKMGNPAECASEMIKATYLRKEVLVYPRSLLRSIVELVHHVCPSALDYIPSLSPIAKLFIKELKDT